MQVDKVGLPEGLVFAIGGRAGPFIGPKPAFVILHPVWVEVPRAVIDSCPRVVTLQQVRDLRPPVADVALAVVLNGGKLLGHVETSQLRGTSSHFGHIGPAEKVDFRDADPDRRLVDGDELSFGVLGQHQTLTIEVVAIDLSAEAFCFGSLGVGCGDLRHDGSVGIRGPHEKQYGDEQRGERLQTTKHEQTLLGWVKVVGALMRDFPKEARTLAHIQVAIQSPRLLAN